MSLEAGDAGIGLHAGPGNGGLRVRDDDGFAAGGAGDFSARGGAIDRQFLFALGTVKDYIHKTFFRKEVVVIACAGG